MQGVHAPPIGRFVAAGRANLVSVSCLSKIGLIVAAFVVASVAVVMVLSAVFEEVAMRDLRRRRNRRRVEMPAE